MDDIRWEDPPPAKEQRRYHHHGVIAERLRSKRGVWAKVAVSPTDRGARRIASVISLGKVPPYEPPGDFEAVWRTVAGEFRVYARFLGDGADE